MGSAAFESADQESFGGGEKGLFSQSSRLMHYEIRVESSSFTGILNLNLHCLKLTCCPIYSNRRK